MRGRVAWALFGISAAFAVTGLILWARTRSIDVSSLPRSTDPVIIVGFLVYTAVGSLIVSRRFGNRVGWIFLAAGLTVEIAMVCQQYGIYALRKSPGSLPGGAWAGWVADLAPSVALGLGTFLLLLFPTGHLVSRRWRPVAWLAGLSIAMLAIGTAFKPGTLEGIDGVDKPVQVDSPFLAGADWAWLGALLALLLTLVSVVVRFRHAKADERQQVKWFLAAAPIFVVGFILIGELNEAISILGALALASLPIAAGIAIFRYHLYDLDVVVRRTLVYGVLTAGLAGLYFGIVIALQEVFSPLTRGNDLAIAGSTLVAAALFRPARGWIQGIVDRRFYRRRYDAAATLEAFSVRLRDEVDLGQLGADLGGVVRDTMQPTHVSLWLRPQREEVE
jgi:hypothetical protein